MAVSGREAIENGSGAITCLEVDDPDPRLIGASLEALWDGSVELGVDSAAHVRL